MGVTMDPVEALRRKLQAVERVARDPGATAAEKDAARAVRNRLRRRLNAAGAPEGNWTDTLFRLGRRLGAIEKSTAPAAPKGDWTDHAHRIGKARRQVVVLGIEGPGTPVRRDRQTRPGGGRAVSVSSRGPNR